MPTAADDAHDSPPSDDTLSRLLIRHRDALTRFLEREARGLARFESAEDLTQGVHLHVLKVADRFEYRDDQSFLAWIFQLARQHVADRNKYWKALKRNAGPMLRISFGGPGDSGSGIDPAAAATGPLTFADRRDRLVRATKAMATLPERDRTIIDLWRNGATIEEIAEALEMSYEAAQRARLRANERFERAYRVLSGTRS